MAGPRWCGLADDLCRSGNGLLSEGKPKRQDRSVSRLSAAGIDPKRPSRCAQVAMQYRIVGSRWISAAPRNLRESNPGASVSPYLLLAGVHAAHHCNRRTGRFNRLRRGGLGWRVPGLMWWPGSYSCRREVRRNDVAHRLLGHNVR